jgi:hypothetical protein
MGLYLKSRVINCSYKNNPQGCGCAALAWRLQPGFKKKLPSEFLQI